MMAAIEPPRAPPMMAMSVYFMAKALHGRAIVARAMTKKAFAGLFRGIYSG